MLSNLLTVSIRNLLRNSGYTLLHILGLTLGITCAIFITLYIVDETSSTISLSPIVRRTIKELITGLRRSSMHSGANLKPLSKKTSLSTSIRAHMKDYWKFMTWRLFAQGQIEVPHLHSYCFTNLLRPQKLCVE